jgi:hypothetical protein
MSGASVDSRPASSILAVCNDDISIELLLEGAHKPRESLPSRTPHDIPEYKHSHT